MKQHDIDTFIDISIAEFLDIFRGDDFFTQLKKKNRFIF